MYEKLTAYWFALISSLLLLDDAEDVKADQKNNEPNAFIETGLDNDGIEQIKQLVKKNLQLLSQVNKTMALKLDKQLVDMYDKPYFQQLINHN